MAKATLSNTTNMRTLLSTMAAGVAAGATAGHLAAVPAVALPVDPVFAGIDAHVTAMAELDHQVALYKAGATDGRTINAGDMFQCAKVVVETAPTTAAGLRALADHLRQHFGYGSGFALCISRPFGGSMMGGGVGAAEWLIAKRAAELA
jgi:hypothetical protein